MDAKAELADKIWITCKTRIIAEERLILNDKVAHFATVWYSFWLLIWSLFQHQIELLVPYAGQMNIALSTLLTIVSVSLYNLKFGQQSEVFKGCYHALQKLEVRVKYAAENELIALQQEYIDILDRTPNHSKFDYLKLLVSRWHQNRPLKEVGREKPRVPTFIEIANFALLLSVRWIVILLLFAMPLGVMILLFLKAHIEPSP